MMLTDLPLALAGNIASAAGLTVFAAGASFLFGFPLAVALLAMRASGWMPLRLLVMTYVSLIRGTPALLQILVAYYVIPAAIGINLSPLTAGIVALALNTAAFTSEVLRGSLNTVPTGQRAAARALGMNPLTMWLHVLLPQVFYRSLPPLTSEFGIVLKATSLLSVISVTELAAVSRETSLQTHQPLEVFAATAAVYFVILLIASTTSRRLEARVARYLPNGT